MKTLLLTQVLPYPPGSGLKIETHNVIRYLAGTMRSHCSPSCMAASRQREWPFFGKVFDAPKVSVYRVVAHGG